MLEALDSPVAPFGPRDPSFQQCLVSKGDMALTTSELAQEQGEARHLGQRLAETQRQADTYKEALTQLADAFQGLGITSLTINNLPAGAEGSQLAGAVR